MEFWEVILTVKEFSRLTGWKERKVQRQAKSGELKSRRALNKKNIRVYLIPLSALEEPLKLKYY